MKKLHGFSETTATEPQVIRDIAATLFPAGSLTADGVLADVVKDVANMPKRGCRSLSVAEQSSGLGQNTEPGVRRGSRDSTSDADGRVQCVSHRRYLPRHVETRLARDDRKTGKTGGGTVLISAAVSSRRYFENFRVGSVGGPYGGSHGRHRSRTVRQTTASRSAARLTTRCASDSSARVTHVVTQWP